MIVPITPENYCAFALNKLLSALNKGKYTVLIQLGYQITRNQKDNRALVKTDSRLRNAISSTSELKTFGECTELRAFNRHHGILQIDTTSALG